MHAESPLKYVNWRSLFVGFIVIVFTLNGVLGYIAQKTSDVPWVSGSLQYLSDLPDMLYTKLPISQNILFELLVRWVLIGLGIYLLLAGVVAVRQQEWRVIGVAVVGLSLGMFIITWIAWTLWLFGLIFEVYLLIIGVLTAIGHWLITPPMLYVTATIGVLLVGLIVFTLISFGKSEVGWRRLLLIGVALLIGGALLWFGGSALLGVGTPILEAIGQWWNEYGSPFLTMVVAFIATLFIYLLGLLVGIVVVVLLGNQLIDQFTSPVVAGQSVGELFDTSFALGAGLATILLVCYANADASQSAGVYQALVNDAWARTIPLFSSLDIVGGAHSLVPGSTQAFLVTVLQGSSLPIFDVACVLIGLFLASCSLLMGVIAGIVPNTWRQVFAIERGLPPLLGTVGGVLITIIVGAINNASSQN